MKKGSATAATALLTVSDVQQVRIDRARVNHETYKQLLGTVYDRIRRRASVNATHLAYNVPVFVPGRPMYTLSHAVRYITDKLRRGGFGVQAGPDGQTLYVDWTPRPQVLPPREPPPPPPPAAGHSTDRSTITARLNALKRKLV